MLRVEETRERIDGVIKPGGQGFVPRDADDRLFVVVAVCLDKGGHQDGLETGNVFAGGLIADDAQRGTVSLLGPVLQRLVCTYRAR